MTHVERPQGRNACRGRGRSLWRVGGSAALGVVTLLGLAACGEGDQAAQGGPAAEATPAADPADELAGRASGSC